MMKRLIIVAPILIVFIALGVYSVQQQRSRNHKFEIQLNQKEIKLKEVEQKKAELESSNNQKIQELEQQKQKLEQDLQAKLEKQQQEALAKAKLEQASRVATSAGTAQASGSCADWIAQAGVTDVQSAITLINRESGCNPNAVNRSSGACGIPQALPCSKLGTNNPVEQIKWMQDYVVRRYGSWAGAVAHSNAKGWY